jgi:hypothetical protein
MTVLRRPLVGWNLDRLGRRRSVRSLWVQMNIWISRVDDTRTPAARCRPWATPLSALQVRILERLGSYDRTIRADQEAKCRVSVS